MTVTGSFFPISEHKFCSVPTWSIVFDFMTSRRTFFLQHVQTLNNNLILKKIAEHMFIEKDT